MEVPLYQACHNSTSCLDTKRQWSNIEKEEVRDSLTGIACEDGSLDSSSISNSFIRVDGLVQLLAVEKVLEQLLDIRDSGRSSNKDNVVDGALIHLGISHGLFHGLEGSLEEVRAEFLKPSSGDGGVEVDSLEERINLDVGLGGRQFSLLSRKQFTVFSELSCCP